MAAPSIEPALGPLAAISSPAPMLAKRVLPHNQEAEESVVGGVLFNGRVLNQIAELLEAQDFYHPALQAIYEAMVELDHQSQPIDIITVAEQMRRASTIGKLRAYNGEAYLAELANKIATVENIAYHARIVRDKATARRLIESAGNIVARGFQDFADVSDYLDEAQRNIFEIANRSTKQSYEPVRKVLNTAIKALELRYNRKEAITGVPTGYMKFDEMTAGLQAGDLVIIAARPSMGKTAFVMNCAQNAALDHAVPTLIFSLEMSKESLIERVLCSEARVDSQRLRGGFLETRDWINITKAASRISEAPMWIDDSGSPTLMEIRAKCRRWRSESNQQHKSLNPLATSAPLGLIIVDYLQLIQGRSQGRDSSREREISEISRGLKALAKELSVPVVALSQLNRSVESRADKRPMASDLRESGAIEQDADLICFIYRDEVYVKDTPDKGVAEIIIGKQRNGPTGTVRLAFLNQYTRFENLAEGRGE